MRRLEPSARAFAFAAVLLPIALAFVHHGLGHRGDIEFFRSWYLAVRESAAFYRDGPGLNYPILGVLLVTAPACLVDALTGHTLDAGEHRMVLKATLVLGEILCVFLSERLARSLGAEQPRRLALLLYVLPSTWAGGAWFGQIDVWGTVFLLAAAVLAIRFRGDGATRSLVLALLALFAAVLTKQLTWFAVPALAVLLGSGLVRHGTRAQWALALLSPLLLFAADPFLVLPEGHRSHLWWVVTHGSPHGELAIASGASLWSLVAAGGTPAASLVWLGLDSRAWGWLAFVIAQLVIARVVWRRPDDRGLVLAAGLGELAMATLLTGVHERYLAHAIPLLVLGRGLAPLPVAGRSASAPVAVVLGAVVGVLSGVFVLASISPGWPWFVARPEPIALLSFAWGIALVVELARRPPLVGSAPMAPTARAARPFVARAALVIASTALSLFFAEVALRVLGIEPDRYAHPWHVETADKRHGLDLYPDDPRGYFQVDLRDPAVRAVYRAEGLDEIDERFEQTPFAVPFVYSEELCRGGEISPRDPARSRVVVIGDSFTEGQGVREEDTFVARLRTQMPETELLNCGRRGYDFPRLREWLDLKLALEPDVVVYAMILNDPEQSEAFHARQAYLDDWILDRRRMFTEGNGAPPFWEPRLFSLVDDRLESARVGAATMRWYQDMVGPPNQDGWDRTLADLEQMDASARAHGATFVVVLWPLMMQLDGEYPFEETHRTIVQALEARHIRAHDTLDAFRGEDASELWVHAADHHPNERGHAIFATAIEAPIRAALTPR